MSEYYLVSICIPCFKRVDLVRNTLQSIYDDNAEVSMDLYEVVISDNDPQKELEVVADEYKDKSNFRYIPTSCEGFMNSYYVLKYGKGKLLKLHNSQNLIMPGILAEIVEQAKIYQQDEPLIFHTNGFLEEFNIREFVDLDTFMKSLSYWSSWSGGMTIWKDDFEKIQDLELNPLFPHTSVFLTQYEKNKFLIDDRVLYKVQRASKRGGHNKFEAFTVHYPSLIDRFYKEGHISIACKDEIYKALYQQYIPTLLFNKYIARIEIFDSTNFKSNCEQFFPKGAYWLAWINTLGVPFRMFMRRFKRLIH